MSHSLSANRIQGNWVLILDKPRGPSSHQVTAWAGEILGAPVGHSGTLDPGVSGVLVVMVGRAVRLAPILLKVEKEYICLLRLHGRADLETVNEAMMEFSGRIYQRPPRKSAVARNLRIRTIKELEVLDMQDRLVLFRVVCDAGTYIRSLCHHIGLFLGTGAHMQELRRTRSGRFHEQMAYTLQDLKDARVIADQGDRSRLDEMLLPVDYATGDLPGVVVRDTAVDAICHGALLAGIGILELPLFKKGDLVAVRTRKGELICLGEALINSVSTRPGEHGLVVAPHTVFMKAGTYPRGWKKKS
ncbi:MAG TPA: RNA-guided pseudouridylation complex pseudouridine synthase subunit Cbf5 [Methanoregulaceae archaeon]|nr:RNA-guided pseudouridylation complex pseudouridine synthase subunit Cbf5 [Methanoregulaceae archaeon]